MSDCSSCSSLGPMKSRTIAPPSRSIAAITSGIDAVRANVAIDGAAPFGVTVNAPSADASSASLGVGRAIRATPEVNAVQQGASECDAMQVQRFGSRSREPSYLLRSSGRHGLCGQRPELFQLTPESRWDRLSERIDVVRHLTNVHSTRDYAHDEWMRSDELQRGGVQVHAELGTHRFER